MSLGKPWRSVGQLYHFTDRANLPFIRAHGGLWSLERLGKMEVTVPRPGGNEWSQDADVRKGMDGYVHLCFTDGHPMEYLACQEGRITTPIYLYIDRSVLDVDGVRFSSGVSNQSGIPILSLDEATEVMDFEVLCTHTNWKDPKIQARRQKVEKYEILVPDHVPLGLIRNMPNG